MLVPVPGVEPTHRAATEHLIEGKQQLKLQLELRAPVSTGGSPDSNTIRLVANYGSASRGWNILLQYGTFRTLGKGEPLGKYSRPKTAAESHLLSESSLPPCLQQGASRGVGGSEAEEEAKRKPVFAHAKVGTARGGAPTADRFEVVDGKIRSAHRITE